MTTAVSSQASTSNRTENRPAPAGAAADRAKTATTRDVPALDAQVKDGSGGSVRGYGLDLDGDDRFDARKDGVVGFDLDRDGRLNGQEIRDSRAALLAYAGNDDADGDGQVSAAEAEQGQRLAGLIQSFDRDGDGRLSGAELKEAGALVQVDGESRGVDDLPVDGQKARLRFLDPLNYGAQIETGQEAPAGEAPAGEAPAGEAPTGAAAGGAAAAGGPASPKGPTVMNPDAPAGFLWKPTSDSDGNLVILLPPNMTGKVAQVNVLSPEGQVLATGKPTGVGNGGREHFRFQQPGSAFPPGVKVQIVMKDGSTREITIQQPGVRNEGSGK